MTSEAYRQLAALVAMPTISDDITANDAALDYIENYLTVRGMFCKRDRFNGHGTLLASTLQTNLYTPTVLLTAHVDTVGGSKEQLTLIKKGDKLIGRGVYDMKFSIAGYLQLVDELQDNLTHYDFGILITTDEEIGSRSTLELVASGLRPKICIMPDSTAPDWNIETVAKGFWRFDLTAQGKTAHGARPWEGDSASFKLIHALHDLKMSFEGHNENSDSLNIGKINGGHGYNVVPAEITAAVEIRYMNNQSLKLQQKMIEELCVKYDLRFTQNILCSSVLTDLDHPLVKKYLESVEAITGKRPVGFVSCAASDAPPYYDAGITCILSCCLGGGHHSDNEWISLTSFMQFVPILHTFLEKTALIESNLAIQKPRPTATIHS
jgi:succinyl-diaminopimelate desuccinylase